MKSTIKRFMSMVVVFATIGTFMAKADSEVSVSVPDVKATSGSQVTVSVNLDNSVEIAACQIFVGLPDGVTIAPKGKGYNVTVPRADDHTASTNLAGGLYKIAIASMNNYSFEGNSGSICDIVLDIAEDMEDGDYDILFTGLEFTEANNKKHTVEDIACKLTIGEDAPAYDEGYAVTIAPFKIEASKNYEVKIDFSCLDEDATGMSFDIELPSVMVFTKSGRAIKQPVFCNDDRIYVDDHSIKLTANGNRATIEVIATALDEYRFIAGTEGNLITLYLTSNASLTEDIHKININNVKIIRETGELVPAPYSADIYVGSPKASVDEGGVVAFHGDYSTEATAALMLEAIPSEDESVTTVDLTGVTALPAETEITTANPNALVTTSTDLGLANDKNVVIGNTCNNLVLTDGNNFSAKKTFTANEASYTREKMPNQWGTIILPYDVESNDDVAYYLPTAIEVGTLKLELKETLPANTPALVAKLNGNGIAPKNANVKVKTKDGVAANGNVTMHGSYAQDTKITDANAYYISSNKFWQCNNYFYIDAFRAYMIIEGGSSAKSFVIDDSITAINAIVGEGDVTVLEYFDITGKRIDGLQKGVNILKLSNGKTQKVIVE